MTILWGWCMESGVALWQWAHQVSLGVWIIANITMYSFMRNLAKTKNKLITWCFCKMCCFCVYWNGVMGQGYKWFSASALKHTTYQLGSSWYDMGSSWNMAMKSLSTARKIVQADSPTLLMDVSIISYRCPLAVISCWE